MLPLRCRLDDIHTCYIKIDSIWDCGVNKTIGIEDVNVDRRWIRCQVFVGGADFDRIGALSFPCMRGRGNVSRVDVGCAVAPINEPLTNMVVCYVTCRSLKGDGLTFIDGHGAGDQTDRRCDVVHFDIDLVCRFYSIIVGQSQHSTKQPIIRVVKWLRGFKGDLSTDIAVINRSNTQADRIGAVAQIECRGKTILL